MSLFANYKRRTESVTVNGEVLVLTEPSALDMCDYWEYVDEQHALVKKDSTNMFKAKINAKTTLKLTAVCLQSSHVDLTHDELFEKLCVSVYEYDDINKLKDTVDKLLNDEKKVTTDTQDGDSAMS